MRHRLEAPGLLIAIATNDTVLLVSSSGALADEADALEGRAYAMARKKGDRRAECAFQRCDCVLARLCVSKRDMYACEHAMDLQGATCA